MRTRLSQIVGRLLPRGVGALAGANMASQLSALAAMPFLTRWCTVGDFGLFQLYLSFTSVAGLVACLRFDYAILQPKDDEVAARLGILAFTLAGISGALSLVAIPLLAFLLGTAGWNELVPLGFTVAAVVTVTGMTSAVTQWLVRRGQFPLIARARLVQSVCVASLQMGGALAGLGGAALVAGDAAGRLAGLIVLLIGSQLVRHCPRAQSDLGGLVRLGQVYLRFVTVATPSALLNAVGFTLPVVFLERYFGTAGVGIYALIERIMGVPSLFVGQPLSQTFIHRLREALPFGHRAAQAEIRETTRTTALLGVLPFGVLMAAGPTLVATVFGEGWRGAGHLAQWVAPAYFIAYVLWPVTPTLVVLDRLFAQISWDGARVIALLALGWSASSGWLSANTMISGIAWLMASFGVIHFVLCERATGQLRVAAPTTR